MTFDEYIEEMRVLAEEWFDENPDAPRTYETVHEEMSLEITGNGVGSFYCNSYEAEEAASDAMSDDRFLDWLRDTGMDLEYAIRHEGKKNGSFDWERLDVFLRIAALEGYAVGDLNLKH